MIISIIGPRKIHDYCNCKWPLAQCWIDPQTHNTHTHTQIEVKRERDRAYAHVQSFWLRKPVWTILPLQAGGIVHALPSLAVATSTPVKLYSPHITFGGGGGGQWLCGSVENITINLKRSTLNYCWCGALHDVPSCSPRAPPSRTTSSWRTTPSPRSPGDVKYGHGMTLQMTYR